MLEGKVALVTGGATGIGRAIADIFSEHGASVCISYLKSEQEAQDFLKNTREVGGEALAVSADCTSEEQVRNLVDKVKFEFGRLDILVNNVGGLVERHPIEGLSLRLWERVFHLNCTSAFLCCREVIPLMKSRGSGHIVNITSVAARTGGGNGAVHYASTKGYLSTFTIGLAKELASCGIRVNAIAPGVIIDTRFHERHSTPEMLEEFREKCPLGRLGVPEDVARCALFLAGEGSGFITGETIDINGGMYMR